MCCEVRLDRTASKPVSVVADVRAANGQRERIPKQEYTAQFKEQAVGMVKNGRSVPEVSRALGLVEQTLRNWVKLAGKGKLKEPGATS